MSIHAVDYALEVAPDAPTPGSRLILLALAARANSRCGIAFAGEWLATTSGLTPRSVRRHIDALENAGIVTLARRPGRASLVRFPTPEVIHNPGHRCPGCRAWGRTQLSARGTQVSATPDTTVPESGRESGREISAAHSVDDATLSVAHVRQIWRQAREQARGAS